MEIHKFVENFASQFEDTDRSEFHPQTIFKDLEEWSSLISLSILAMVDDEYDVKITGNDIRNANSIEDLFNIVKAKHGK